MTRPHLRLGVGVALVAAVLPAAALAAATRLATPAAQVRSLTLSAGDDHVRVSGIVHLTPNTARHRANTAVAIAITGSGGVDHDVVGLSGRDTFSDVIDTALTGRLTVTVRTLAGLDRTVGPAVRRTIVVSGTPASGSTSSTTTTSSSSPAITTSAPTANEVPLVGTFTIAGGSTFEMLNGAVPIPNPSAGGITTPLSAGTDGGLETFGYQPAPSPAFAGSGGKSGGALADRIIKPVAFEGIDFSIQTSPSDAQTGTAVPVPVIETNAAGILSGQITAWDAQYNGLSFNQGTPKPDGSTPGATSKLSGTYDYATGAYTLNWESRIVGGPFNGFTGSWHLKGTFEPATFG